MGHTPLDRITPSIAPKVIQMAKTLVASLAALVAAAISPLVFADSEKLAGVLAAQPEAVQARYAHRHPQETLEFFGIEPGMTVVEVLPGRSGWYTKILLPYLGPEGKVVGADYPLEAWAAVYDNEEFLASRKTWPTDWPAQAMDWTGEDGASVDAFTLGALPEAMQESADAFLLIRAMHNLNRAAEDGAHLKAAIADAWNALKPGGVVGIVQHESPEERTDAWANGANGYLKRSYVMGLMEAAGFELAAESDINANDKDQPTEEDIVWRLPPRYAGVDQDDSEGRAARDAIGESNRMTLKFVKPAS